MDLKYAMLAAAVVVLGVGCRESTERPTEQAPTGPPARAQSAEAHAGLHWGYEGDAGPANWGTLSAEWSSCADGRSQSPVDLGQAAPAAVPSLSTRFQPVSLSVIHHEHVADGINNGHTIQFDYEGADVTTVGSEPFALVQFHFHSPSEHRIAGRSYPMEMHLVHRSDRGHLAVVGVFIADGAHNAAFEPLWANLPATRSTTVHLEHLRVDVDQLLPADRTSYRYDGSLTTPPCTEGVKWIVLATPIEMSAGQIATFRSIVSGNARPPQPLNGRRIVTDRLADGGT